MIRGESVMVGRFGAPAAGLDSSDPPIDRFAAPDLKFIEESSVDNVLFAPTKASDMPESNRVAGTRCEAVFHFPATFTGSLRRCVIFYKKKFWWVIGDPQPYPVQNTPGPWNRPVHAYTTNG